jgi:hypothetical protein
LVTGRFIGLMGFIGFIGWSRKEGETSYFVGITTDILILYWYWSWEWEVLNVESYSQVLGIGSCIVYSRVSG